MKYLTPSLENTKKYYHAGTILKLTNIIRHCVKTLTDLTNTEYLMEKKLSI